MRGESMQVWGVQEARTLGSRMCSSMPVPTPRPWKQYAEVAGDAGEIPMGMMVPGIEGSLNLRHPVACQALVDAAAGPAPTSCAGSRT